MSSITIRRLMATVASRTLVDNLKIVNDRISASFELSRNVRPTSTFPRLVAVSKTKPIDDILTVYDAGQRHFGENYVKELIEKANDERILERCPDIQWHFIGTLQTNKASKICSRVPNIYVVETVDSERLADAMQNCLAKSSSASILNVFIQVNTSGEDQKSGVEPAKAHQLAELVLKRCDNLRLKGFMTIGSLEQSTQIRDENADFKVLANVREEFCRKNDLSIKDIELSMGMSADFETAIKMGSTNVRIGSTIFGSR